MYANRKGWPLKSCDATIRMGDGNKKDLNAPTTFDVTVAFEGPLSVEQRERLLDIANRCPVHKALTQPIQIRVVAI
jgi:putative redox protein